MSDENLVGLVELLPCPCCNSAAQLSDEYEDCDGNPAVECSQCNLLSWAVSDWNTRALSAHGQTVVDGRYFADGPQGWFVTDNPELARALVNAYDNGDDWTVMAVAAMRFHLTVGAAKWATELRALAQPAEAVEGAVGAVVVTNGRANGVLLTNDLPDGALLYVKPTHDAAQGAVATVCLVGERYAHGHMVSVELQLAGEDAPAPKIGDRYYTHPQAAPAQGDGWKLVPVEATMEMLTAGAVARAKDAGEDHYDDAKLIYEAMIAAAPSQEGE